jgi:cellulose synthase/poly-beta-1,6-N-acetylglucosamine synthase-like glycosyltransferase
VEQIARSRNDLFLNFNGTAGVWRRECIQDAGGWHTDTLTEDLDLSYRAQLRGWKFVFLPDVVAPAEVPPQLHAFKRQQFRWAKGSTQCLMKLAPRVLGARDLSLSKRVEGLLHLSGYLMNPLMLLLLLTLVPLIALDTQFPQGLTVFSLSIFGPLVLYGLAQRELYADWGERMRSFPVLTLIGIGMAFNDSLAVWQALTRQGSSSFRRTPKFRVESDQDGWSDKRYTLPFSWEAVGELVLALYALFGARLAWQHQLIWSIPFLLLYAGSLGYVAALSLWHARPSRAREIELAAAN